MRKNLLLGIVILAISSVFAQPTIDNNFFDKVNYRGAFGTSDWTAGWANFNPQNTAYGAATVTIPAGNITANTTWTKNNVYLLDGWVYVKEGATLTIEAGTVIRGDKTNKGALIVEKGAKLIANGTVTEPIVFTSNQAAGSRTYGDWGGIILCGKAPINVIGGSATIEGGVGSTYGGADAADNSGSLQYVRIEFPGIAFATNNEINGLTMGGVGTGTTVDYVQVSYSGDDSFEWFGGTVNAKHLIALRGTDDDFDTDFGYSGMVQFGVSLRDPNVADVAGKSNCFESDNDSGGTNNTPFTTAIFSNISSFGPKATTSSTCSSFYQAAINVKKNTKLQVYNSVLAGWVNGIKVESENTKTNMVNNDIKVRNSIISGVNSGSEFTLSSVTTWTATDMLNWFNTASFNNSILSDNSSLLVNNPFNLTAPDFDLNATSMLKVLSYWNANGSAYAYNMPIVATALVNGSTLSANGSILMAYKNGTSVGSAFLNTANNQFALTVGSEVASASDLDLKLYDASSEMLYNLPTTFDFTNGGSFGTSGSPEVLQATASLSIPVNPNGYTWISFNVLPENKSITNVLNYNVQDGDELFGQGISANYDGGWDGIDFIEKNKMYVLKTSNPTPGSITVTNQPLVKNTSVTVKNGFTWIGYSLVSSASVNAAFSGMAINDGTQLFGQGVSDSYEEGAWEGLTLYPGKGYKIKTTSPQSTFNYPSKLGSPARVSSLSTEGVPSDWVSPTNMQNTANAYIKVYNGGVLQATAGMVLAAFKGTECRGTKTLTGTRTYFALPISSNFSNESGFTFKLYDPANGGTVYGINETLDNFDCVNGYGSSSNTLLYNITSTSINENTINSNKFNVYPNPVKDVFQLSLNSEISTNTKIDLYDLQGKHIQTIYSGVVNTNNAIEVNRDRSISNGMYLIKATVGSEKFITKVVLQ